MFARKKKNDASAKKLAQLRERVRSSDETIRSDRTAYEALKLEGASLRHDLDNERDETARLRERATRVPLLEQDTIRLAEELRLSGLELRAVSNDAAQKGQAVTSFTEKHVRLYALMH